MPLEIKTSFSPILCKWNKIKNKYEAVKKINFKTMKNF